jgi:tRNA nucleotidyltransferase (CCA-adding enzyme)
MLPPGTALVGGAVRDGLLGRLGERPDLDLVVTGDGLALTQEWAQRLGGTAVTLDRERSIGRLVLDGWTLDVARQQGGSLEADLHRRDYTINAIAWLLPLDAAPGALVDPLHGLEDLRDGVLRAIAEANLLDDPLRLLRGPRLAAELGCTIAPQSWEWIVTHRARLKTVAGERVLAELMRLVRGAEGARGVELLRRGGLLEAWTAGPATSGPSRPATAHLTLEEARRRGFTDTEANAALPMARLAALLDEHALGAMHASKALRRRCRHVRRWRQRLMALGLIEQGFGALPEDEQLDLHNQLGEDLPALLLELPPSVARAALSRWRDLDDPLFHPQSPMDGLALQRHLGLSPGPRLGSLLAYLMAERAFGRLPRDPRLDSQTLRVARGWLADKGDPCHD